MSFFKPADVPLALDTADSLLLAKTCALFGACVPDLLPRLTCAALHFAEGLFYTHVDTQGCHLQQTGPFGPVEVVLHRFFDHGSTRCHVQPLVLDRQTATRLKTLGLRLGGLDVASTWRGTLRLYMCLVLDAACKGRPVALAGGSLAAPQALDLAARLAP